MIRISFGMSGQVPLSYMGIADDNFWQNVSQELSIFAIVFAFILFRFFDIVKPPPIGWADKRVAGGLGIMLDDIIAGIMAAVVWVAVMFGVLL
jgi:phosphatidylglycerophosphatase A